jgi:hypothetical protein
VRIKISNNRIATNDLLFMLSNLLTHMHTNNNNNNTQFQYFRDRVAPFLYRRWGATAALLFLFMLRIYMAGGWYIVTYALGIYVLNLFIHFLTPKSDPESGTIQMIFQSQLCVHNKQQMVLYCHNQVTMSFVLLRECFPNSSFGGPLLAPLCLPSLPRCSPCLIFQCIGLYWQCTL